MTWTFRSRAGLPVPRGAAGEGRSWTPFLLEEGNRIGQKTPQTEDLNLGKKSHQSAPFPRILPSNNGGEGTD